MRTPEQIQENIDTFIENANAREQGLEKAIADGRVKSDSEYAQTVRATVSGIRKGVAEDRGELEYAIAVAEANAANVLSEDELIEQAAQHVAIQMKIDNRARELASDPELLKTSIEATKAKVESKNSESTQSISTELPISEEPVIGPTYEVVNDQGEPTLLDRIL